MSRLYLATLILTMGVAVSAAPAQTSENTRIVREFYELAFNQHKPREAAERFIGSRYIQHNPHAPDGAKAFVDFFEGYFKNNKTVSVEIKRTIAEGDFVVLHVHSRQSPSDRGTAVVDIFRVENGKIVEHWDVAQEVPEKLAHGNTMF